MADSNDPKADASAEKAYAAAAEAVGDSASKSDDAAVVEGGAEAAPVEFPAKPKRVRKSVEAEKPVETDTPAEVLPQASVEPVAEVPAPAPVSNIVPVAPVVEPPLAAESAPQLKPRPARAAVNPLKTPRAAKAGKPVAKKVVKRAVAKPALPPQTSGSPAKVRKPAVQQIKTAYKAAPQTVKASPVAAPKTSLIAQLKEIPMDVTTSIKDAVNGAQEKAKEAYAKGSAFAGEYTDFAKGNVEALVESGKILASGLQELGNSFIAESKSAFETATSDVKALTSVKSPTDFFKLQTDLLRRNFDNAVAYSSKTGEAVIKLTGDVIAPISGRVTLAVEKVKKAA